MSVGKINTFRRDSDETYLQIRQLLSLLQGNGVGHLLRPYRVLDFSRESVIHGGRAYGVYENGAHGVGGALASSEQEEKTLRLALFFCEAASHQTRQKVLMILTTIGCSKATADLISCETNRKLARVPKRRERRKQYDRQADAYPMSAPKPFLSLLFGPINLSTKGENAILRIQRMSATVDILGQSSSTVPKNS